MQSNTGERLQVQTCGDFAHHTSGSLLVSPVLSLGSQGACCGKVVLFLQEVEGHPPCDVGSGTSPDPHLACHVAQYVGNAGVRPADHQGLVQYFLNH